MRYGCIPDRLDTRDHLFIAKPKALPVSADMDLIRPGQPRLDQGDLGCCVYNGTAGNVLFHQPDFMLSRLWGYYKTRQMEGDVSEDAGCEIRDAIKVITKLGAPPESEWPYDISKFAKRPPAKATRDAKKEVITAYKRIVTLQDAHACLAAGAPYLVGILLYESFESEAVAKTGIVPMPEPGEKIVGGHCMLGWAYDPTTDTTLNSWGIDWGDRGKAHFPRAYMANSKLVSDRWSITSCQQRTS